MTGGCFVIITFAFYFCFGQNFLSDEIEMFLVAFDELVVLSIQMNQGPPYPPTHFFKTHLQIQPTLMKI